VTRRDILDGLRLTGTFLESRVLFPRDMTMPEARHRLVSALSRESRKEEEA